MVSRSFFGSPHVKVQKVKKAPEKAFFMGCFANKEKHPYGGKLGDFVTKVLSKNNITNVMENLDQSYTIAKQVFQAKPALLYDFQAMIDMEGRLHYIDFDEHFNYRPGGWGDDHIKGADSCLEKIGRVKRVLEASLAGNPLRNIEGRLPN